MRLIKKKIETHLEDSEHIQYVKTFSDLAMNYKLEHSQFDLQIQENEDDWKIIAIVGKSGSGKSTLLKTLIKQEYERPQWNERPILEHIHADPQESVSCLTSVGLNSVPCWLKPYNVLSTGEKYRSNLAWAFSRYDHLCFDEFASVVDEDTAMSSSVSLHKAIHRTDKKMIVATCRRDILPYLKPCIVVDLDKEQIITARGWERQEFKLQLHRVDHSYWKWFAHYHYLNRELPHGTHNFLISCIFPDEKEKIIGFHAITRFPHPYKNGWLSSRVVVLPQFQGMGFGTKITELTGNYLVGRNFRLFCKTSHPILGRYRNKNTDKWRPTYHNMQKRADYVRRGVENGFTKRKGKEKKEVSEEKIKWASQRMSYAHEYIGGTTYVDKSLKQMSLF